MEFLAFSLHLLHNTKAERLSWRGERWSPQVKELLGSLLSGQISQDDDVRKEKLLNLDDNECLPQKSRLVLNSVLRLTFAVSRAGNFICTS